MFHLGYQLPRFRLLLGVEELEDLRLRAGAGQRQLRFDRRDLMDFGLQQAIVGRHAQHGGVEGLRAWPSVSISTFS